MIVVVGNFVLNYVNDLCFCGLGSLLGWTSNTDRSNGSIISIGSFGDLNAASSRALNLFDSCSTFANNQSYIGVRNLYLDKFVSLCECLLDFGFSIVSPTTTVAAATTTTTSANTGPTASVIIASVVSSSTLERRTVVTASSSSLYTILDHTFYYSTTLVDRFLLHSLKRDNSVCLSWFEFMFFLDLNLATRSRLHRANSFPTPSDLYKNELKRRSKSN